MKKVRLKHFLILAVIILCLGLLTFEIEEVYTAEGELTHYRILQDGSLLARKTENEKGERYILIRDRESMKPEYISKEEYERLVAENPLSVTVSTQNQSGDGNSE